VSTPSEHDVPAEPWLEREIEDAVATYRDRLSPDDLEWMRAQLRASVLRGAAASIARAARPRDVIASGAVAYAAPSDEATTAPIAPPRGRAGGSG
jgi:hypothetical protein